jgi:hypothetical protein
LGCQGDYQDQGDESDTCDPISTASWRQQPATALERFDLEPSDIEKHQGQDGNDADADEEEEASPAND